MPGPTSDPPSPSAPTEPDEPPRRSAADSPWLLLLVVALAVGAHAGGIDGEPVHLDDSVVPWAETAGLGAGDAVTWTLDVHAEPERRRPPGPWAPVPALLLATTAALEEARVPAMHVLALIVHGVAVLLVRRLARALGAPAAAATCAALVFGLHPLLVESTAWISGFGALLAATFGLAALGSFARDGARGRLGPGPGVCTALALLSHPMGVAIVPAAFLLLLAPPRSDGPPASIGRRTFAFLPVVLGAFAVWVVRAAAFGSAAAGHEDELARFGWHGATTLWSAVATLGGAVELVLWPFDGRVFRPPLVGPGPADAAVLRALAFAAVTVVVAGFAAWRGGPRGRTVGLALGALVASLLPLAIASEAASDYALSDRHLALPVALASIGVVGAAFALPRLATPVAAALALGAAAVLGWHTVERVPVWRDDLSLFAFAIEGTPDSARVRWLYSRELLLEYQTFGEVSDLEAAHDQIGVAQDLLDRANREGSRIHVRRPEDFVRTNLGLGWCFLALADVDEYYDYQTPRQIFEMLAESAPGMSEAHLGAGLSSMALGESEAAKEAFERALEADPENGDAHHNLGLLRMNQGLWSAAAEHFEDAARLRPSNPADRVWLARALVQQGQVDRASREAERAHDLDPYHPDAMVLLGVIELQRGNPVLAQRWIDRALAARPKDGFARLQRGHAFLAQGDLANALVEYRRSTELAPSYEAFHSLANGFLQIGEKKAAAEQFVRAYELMPPGESLDEMRRLLAAEFPDLAGAHFGFAGVDLARGQVEAARAWTSSALEIEPTHAGALHLQGLMQRADGDTEAAVASFRAALQTLPNSFQVRHDLGYLLVEIGRPAEAVPHLERALALVPEGAGVDGAADRIRAKIRTTLDELASNG